jgi:hypothetical protein
LQQMGTGRFKASLEGETPKEALDAMKKNIFEGKYENVKQYVGSMHLLEAFCMPIIFSNHFYKPRA